MKKIKVYIAGPYANDPIGNTNTAIEVWETLFKKGFIPFCPHLTHFLQEKFPHKLDEWMNYDFEWIKVCDVMFRIEGYSVGADAEVALAKKLGIPVFTSLFELENRYATKEEDNQLQIRFAQ